VRSCMLVSWDKHGANNAIAVVSSDGEHMLSLKIGDVLHEARFGCRAWKHAVKAPYKVGDDL